MIFDSKIDTSCFLEIQQSVKICFTLLEMSYIVYEVGWISMVILIIQVAKFESCQYWKLTNSKVDKIESGQNWTLPKLNIAEIENCQNWTLPKLDIAEIEKLPKLKIAKLLNC